MILRASAVVACTMEINLGKVWELGRGGGVGGGTVSRLSEVLGSRCLQVFASQTAGLSGP